MTLAIYTGVAIDSAGNAVSGADVEVRLESSGALAAIWSDEAGTIAIANPATALTDANGRFSFYAAGADRGYSVKVTKSADTYTLHNQAVGTAGQLDQASFVLQSVFGATGDYVRATGAGASAKAGPGFQVWNGTLVASQNGTVLTVAVKTSSGGDPSATDPVYVSFRDVTSKNGTLTTLKLTAATSIATTVGGTFGVANSVAFRLWVVGFNDGGTFRLALINCLTTAAGAGAGRDVTKIFPLAEFGIDSATQIGAGSTSAQTFYSFGAAVSSKAYTVLGYLTYEAGLATAGTFAVDQSRLEPFRPGVPLPGQLIQIVRTDTGAVATGTTTVPADDTIPQNTEGDQYMSQAITPNSAANALRVSAQGVWTSGSAANNNMVASIYQDTTANALKSTLDVQNPGAATNNGRAIKVDTVVLAAGTASTTFKVRAGYGNAGTTTFNGTGAARLYGGVMNSYIEVQELMA